MIKKAELKIRLAAADPNEWFLISGDSVNDLNWLMHKLSSTLSGEDQYKIQKMIGEGILPEIQDPRTGELTPWDTTDQADKPSDNQPLHRNGRLPFIRKGFETLQASEVE